MASRTPKRYSAGSIMLQVVPTLRGIEDAIDPEAKKIGDRIRDETKRGAEEGAKEQVKARKRAADEIRKLDENGSANRQRWAAEETAREQKRARDYVGFWTKALDEQDAAEEKSAAKRAELRKKDVADREAAIAKEKAANEKAARDRARAEEKEFERGKAALAAADKEFAASLEKRGKLAEAARAKEEKAQEAARAKEDRLEKAFLHSQGLAEVEGQGRLRERRLTDRQNTSMARAVQKMLRDTEFEIELKPDGNMFEREMADIITRMNALKDVKIGVDMDAKQFNIEWAGLEARLQKLKGQNVDLEVKADTIGVVLQLEAVQAQMRATQREAIKTRAATEGMDNSAGSAANSFRAMNGVLLAAVAIGPILIPILASIGGLLVGIAAGAIGVGLAVGVMVLGLMGIGDAISAMSKADEDAKQRAAKGALASSQGPRPTNPYSARRTEISRDYALRDARERLSDARAAAPVAIDDALGRQESAERSLMDAQERARKTQEDLNEARKQAARDLEDLNYQVRQANIDEQQAKYDLQRAGIRYNTVLEDDQATAREKDEARLAYEEAQLSYDKMLSDNARLREDAKKAEKAGVEGSEAVVAAKQNIKDADAEVASAREDVVAAEKNVADVRVEQAERIADAERNLAELIADQKLQRQAEAWDRANTAALAAAGGTDDFSTAAFDLQQKMDALSPAGQRFATWLYGLKPLFDALKFTVQETFLPGLQTALDTIITKYAPGFTDFVGVMGSALGEGAVSIADWLTGPEMSSFFATLAEYGPTWFQQFLDIGMGFSTGIFSIFEQLAPFATVLGDALVDLAAGFAEWANSKEGQEAIAAFVGYLLEAGPDTWQLFASMMGAIVNLMIALAPYGEGLIQLFTAVFDWIAGMDPADLALIAGAIMGIIIAFQVMAIVGAVVLTTFGLVSTGMLGVIALVVGAIAGLAIFIAVNWPRIKKWFSDLYHEYIKPVVDWIAEKWNWLYDNVLYPVWEAIRVGLELLGTYVDIVKNLWIIAMGLIGDAWNTFYDDYLAEPIQAIKDGLSALGDWFSENLYPVWEKAIKGLGELWTWISEMAKKPIRFVLETVINKGIIDNFNDFASNFPGTTEVKHITVPSWLQPAEGYASGGILPGYTPGRDVHQFYSPTGGRIDLSGGEGILRPEAVQALGPDWINRVNAIARGRGVPGVMRHLGGYADGGILGAIGDFAGGAVAAFQSVVGTVAEFIRDPKKALQTAIKALIGDRDTDTPFGSLLLSVPNAIISAATDYVRSIFTNEVMAKGPMQSLDLSSEHNLRGWANPSFGRITSGWGPRSMFGNTFHAGTDIAGGGKVFAAAAGKVLHAGLVNPFVAPGRSGSTVQILHDDGTVTWYGHMLPKNMLVNKGDSVLAGQRIGIQGALGNVTGVHLHYETHLGQDKGNGVDPVPFMSQRGVNLGKGLIAGGGGKPALLYDNGGYLQPGYNLVENRTGKPEPVLTDKQWEALMGRGRGGMTQPGVFDGAVLMGYDPSELFDEYEERRHQAQVLAGADDIAVMLP